MTTSSLRDLRKFVYRLEEHDGPVGRALFQAILYGYRCYDTVFLKRAKRPDYASEKVLMPGDRVLFVGVPKTGTRSILKALQSSASAAKRAPIIAEVDIETLFCRHPEAKSYFKFTFVRNPWSRTTSCYRDKILNADAIKQARHLHNRQGLEAGMPFDAFAEWLNSPEGSDDVADRHWMSQHRILAYDQPGVIKYDFVGRFEHIAQDYERLMEMSGLLLSQLPHQLKTQGPDEYRSLYNDRSNELIAKRYARDIELFGYDFDTEIP